MLHDRVRPSILWYTSYLHALFSSVRSRSRTGTVPLVYLYCCAPSCLHSSCCTTAYTPVYFGANSHLRALRRDVRSGSHTYLVYWYCCIPSCLHSSCCTTAYALVQSRTCKHSFMLYDLVHRGILLHKSLHSKTVPCMASCCTPRTPARLCCTSTYATV